MAKLSRAQILTDRERILTIQIIHSIIVQSVLIAVALIAFGIVFYKFVVSDTAFDATKFGAANTMLGYTIYRIYKYFFPSKEKKLAPNETTASSSASTPA